MGGGAARGELDKGKRDDDILWAEEPKRRWLRGRSLTVWPNQVGLVMKDGKFLYPFTERQDRLPKGDVQTYVASTAEFTLSFWLNDPSDPSPPSEGVALDMPVFTADRQLVTGRIYLTLSVDVDNAHYLLPLSRRRGAVGAEEIEEAVKEDVQAALVHSLQGQTFADLRGNTKAIRAIRDALKTEMTPSVRRYGLWLRNLSVTWGLTPEERERIKEDRHRSAVRDIEREAEIGEARPRPRSMKRWVVWGGVGVAAVAVIMVAAALFGESRPPQTAASAPAPAGAAAALPTPTPTAAPTATPPPTAAPSPTRAMPTPVPTATPPAARPAIAPTMPAMPTDTPVPTHPPTAQARATLPPRAANTPAPTRTPTHTPTNTPVPTHTHTPTNTPVPTATPTPTNTPVPTATPTPTNTPVPTAVPTSTPISGKQAGTLLRTITVGGRVLSSPAVLGGTMYVGSDDGHLYAVDIASQRELWRFAAGARIASSPAVSNGVVYVGSNDRHLYAIDAANGTLRWKHETGAEVFSSPAVSNGIVYVGSDDNHLYAFDATNGTLRWQYETEDWVSTDPAVGGGAVYVRSQDGILHAVDASTGEGLWQHNTDWEKSASGLSASPAFADGVVYVGGGNRMHALDASSGEWVWVYETEVNVYSLTVADGVVYAGAEDGHLYALDASTRALLWLYDGIQPTDDAPMVVDGAVYVQSEDGHLYALDEFTGRLLWRSEMGGVSAAPRASGGVVYTGANGGKVYGMVASSPLSTAAPAQEREAGDLLWRYQADADLVSQPTAVNGLLYIGGGGYLYAIDGATGSLAWRYKTGALVLEPPAVADGTVYARAVNGALYALDARSGELRWQYQAGESAKPSPTANGGVVFTGSDDGSVHAVDASTGGLIWRYRTDGPVIYAPVVADDAVYVVSWDEEARDGQVYALDAVTGRLLWQHKRQTFPQYGSPQTVLPASPPVVVNGTVFVPYGRGWTELVADTGENLGDYGHRDIDMHSLTAAEGIMYRITSPTYDAVYNHRASWHHKLIADDNLSVTGELWGHVLGYGDDWSTGSSLEWIQNSLLVAGGVTYAYNYRGTLHAFDALTGESLWAHEVGTLDRTVDRAPVIANGVMYVTNERSVSAFVLPELPSSVATPTPTPTSTPNPLQRAR